MKKLCTITQFTLLVTCLLSNSSMANLKNELAASQLKIAYEHYTENNWEIFVAAMDGSEPVNLTNTIGEHEIYPQVSPDGKKIAFLVDKGIYRDNIRTLYVMNMDGTNRTKVADYVRQPCWHPDSKTIAYLPQRVKYPFYAVEYYTDGLMFYDVVNQTHTRHPNKAIKGLYNLNYSSNGEWIIATVHGGLDLNQGIVLIEANGNKTIDLNLEGCRPMFSPDMKQIAWNLSSNEIVVANIYWTVEEADEAYGIADGDDGDGEGEEGDDNGDEEESDEDNGDEGDDNGEGDEEEDEEFLPEVDEPIFTIKDEKLKIFHVDWSPDGKYLSFSRGPDGNGNANKYGTQMEANEIVGVHADNWNIYAVKIIPEKTVTMNTAEMDLDYYQITYDGLSNKEPDWFLPK